MFVFVTSVISLVGIETFLHKVGGGGVVYLGWRVNFQFIFIGLCALFAGFCLS